jgi:hypothetical protein
VESDPDCVFVVVDPEPLPLDPGATYAIVVRDGIRGLDGAPLVSMSTGELLVAPDPVPDPRVEAVRGEVEVLLDLLGRGSVVAAWPFTTLDPAADLADLAALPASLAYDATPTVLDRGPPAALFGDDPLSDLFPGLLNPAEPLYLPRVAGVAEVVEGTLPSPVHLHPVTRRWTEPPVVDAIHFLATIPEGVAAGEPVPVVIFAHSVVSDRRWALTIAGELARYGLAAIAVDLPYHGERIACVERSLVAIPNFLPDALQPALGLTDPMLELPPCSSGTASTCAPTGECLGPDGLVEPFNALPLVDIRPAAGAAFLDLDDLGAIPDHFRQSVVDLAAVRYSLQNADWQAALGRPIRTDRFLFAGQSLGAIVGALYVPSDPTIARAVLNVPGADLVDLMQDSDVLGPQLAAWLDEVGVVEGTWEHRQLLGATRWVLDGVDPHSVGHLFADRGIDAVIQMDRVSADVGDMVIPNACTDTLAEVSGLPVIEYPSVLHTDLLIPLAGDEMLRDLAAILGD